MGIRLLLGLIQNDKLLLCIPAGDIELEVWTCGVDRFSQYGWKFESRAELLQTSALSQEFFPLASRPNQSDVFFPATHQVLLTRQYLRKLEPSWVRRESGSALFLRGTGSQALVSESLHLFPQRSALCPLTDTNTNIIPTGGGNSFLTWMIKIFLKSMIMTSCGMGSKHNYCRWCKCFPPLRYFLLPLCP